MGLDMYLTGDKFTPTHDGRHKRALVDGYEVESQRLSMGQWRKHWALHEYIQENYGHGDGKIELEDKNLLEIADAVEQGKLPVVEYSTEIDAFHKEPEQAAETAKIFRDAAAWLQRKDGFWRDVEYYGSW